MITGTSTTTDVANMEHMFVIGTDDQGNHFSATIMREELTPEEQSDYDAGVILVSGNMFTVINNTVSDLQISRMTSSVVTEDEGVYDFSTMSAGDQDALRGLLALFISKKD
jgi:hypothetical protein